MRLWLADRHVDLVTRDVTRAGHDTVRLTTKEAELLGYLAGRGGEEVPRGDLLGDVWGYAPTAKTRAVDFTVRRLRQKVEANPAEPAHIVTVHGVGYRFDPGEAPSVEAEPRAAVAADLSVAPPSGPTFGREAALAMIVDAFERGARMVTLLGPVGVGKSHLARVAASSWPHPAAWVAAEGDLIAAVAAALGLAIGRAERVGVALRRAGPLLLVLDGVEELSADELRMLGGWLRAAPELRLLVTARERLGLGAEHVLSLAGLQPADAAQLARASGADEGVIGTLVEQLDGLPLALILAARTGSTAASGSGAILRALDGAWARLDEPLRQAWARLAVCTDGVDLDGAEHLLDDPLAVDRLERLQDRGLLRSEDRANGLRFRLLDSVRRYGLQRLGGDRDAVWDRRVGWVVGRAWPAVARGEPVSSSVEAQLGADAADLRAAWAEHERVPEQAVRAAALLALLGARPDVDLPRSVAATSLTDSVDAQLVLMRGQTQLLLRRGDVDAAVERASRAVALGRTSGRALHEAEAGHHLAHALRLAGRLAEAGEAARHAAETFARAGRPGRAGVALTQLGRVLLEQGAFADAEAVLREALHRARLAQRPLDRAEALLVLSTLLRHAKRLPAAHDCTVEADEALVSVHHADPRLPAMRARLDLGRAILRLEEGRTEEARAATDAALLVLDRQGHPRDAAVAGLARATLLWSDGQADEAADLLADVREGFGQTGDRLYSGLALAWSAAVAAALGERDEAGAMLRDAADILEPLGLSRGTAVLRAASAHVDLAEGRPVDAAVAWSHEVEAADHAWGDVRQVLRMLRQTLEVRDAQ